MPAESPGRGIGALVTETVKGHENDRGVADVDIVDVGVGVAESVEVAVIVGDGVLEILTLGVPDDVIVTEGVIDGVGLRVLVGV